LFYGRRHIRGIILDTRRLLKPQIAIAVVKPARKIEKEGPNDDFGAFPWIDAMDALVMVHRPAPFNNFLIEMSRLEIFELPTTARTDNTPISTVANASNFRDLAINCVK
jgi:hypothetical protein